MSDEFEDLLKRWLRERGTTDRSALQAMAGQVAVLPPRRRRRPTNLAAVAAVIVALGLAAFALAPRSGSVTAPVTGPVGPDPAAFAGDPRLARCGATVATAFAAFEMTQARDYRLHLPAMGLSPELDVDSPAFVVVYRGLQPLGVFGAPPPSGETWPPRTEVPGHHDVCILVGADPASAELNVYEDVDITGLTVAVVATSPSVAPARATPSANPGPPSITPEPGPAWAGDARSALQCDGQPLDLGTEASPNPDEVQGDTPEQAVRVVEQRAWALRLDVPVAGFTASTVDGPARLFVHLVGDRPRAAVAVTTWDGGPDGPWYASSVASCGDQELDPTTPTGTQPFGRWSDAAGAPAEPSVLTAAPGCYDGTQVTFRARLYVRSPEGGVDPSQLESAWAAEVPLPTTALDTGLRSGPLRLFIAADRTALYVVGGDRAERLPHVIGDEILRTDCN